MSMFASFRRLSLLPAVFLFAFLVAVGPIAVRAQDKTEGFSEGQRVGGSSGPTFGAGPAALSYKDQLWVYGTTSDGKAQYATYDGKQWSTWQGWNDQPATFKWEAAPVVYHDDTVVFYAGQDGKLYYDRYDGDAWAGWEAAAGDYSFAAAPYVTTYAGDLDLYAVAGDGTLYEESYNGTDWSQWGPVSDSGKVGAYQPYALDWGNHENVFWTGTDGKVYWNRYDGDDWGTPTALAGNETFADAPYAVGYKDNLYAYASGKDGAPYYNVFDGNKWAGWASYDQAPPAKVGYQPRADAKGDNQLVVDTGTNNHGYAATYDGKTWSQWQDLGDSVNYAPYLTDYGDDLYLTYTGKDGAIYYAVYGSGNKSGY